MTRMFLSLFLTFIFAAPCLADPNIVLFSVAVNSTAIVENTDDVFAKEGEKINHAILDNQVCPIKSKLLYSKDATRQALLDGFKWVEKAANKDSLVIIYIGAHGGTGQSGYFCCVANDCVYAFELKPTLERLPCKVLLIVDTCHAGAFFAGWDSNKNTFVIAACRADETASVWYVANPFADAVIEADCNKNGLIDTEELFNYLVENVNPSQHVVGSGYQFKADMMRAPPETKSENNDDCSHVILTLWLGLYVVVRKVVSAHTCPYEQ